MRSFLKALPLRWSGGATRVPILMYHYIRVNPYPKDKASATLSVAPDEFAAQMAYLAQNGYTSITLDTLYDIFQEQLSSPAKPVVLTFDDGYADFYLNAYPILQKYGLLAVCFVITGSVGQERYLSWDQIREMQSSGLIRFEAHTVTHPNLTKLSYTELLGELQGSKDRLEAQTDRIAHFISYPYGRTNSLVMSAARKVGFAGGIGTSYGKASYPGMNMPRIEVKGHMTLKEFARRV